MFCIIKIKSETNSHHSEESTSAQNRKSCNTAIRSVCHTPEQQRRRNGLRCAALFLRLRTVPRPGLRPRAGWLRLRAGGAHASRGLRLAAPHGRRGGYRLRAGSIPCVEGAPPTLIIAYFAQPPRPLSYSAIKQWPGGCGFILSLWPAFVNP